MNKTQFLKLCKDNHACSDGMDWCRQQPGDLADLFRAMEAVTLEGSRRNYQRWTFLNLMEWGDDSQAHKTAVDLAKAWKIPNFPTRGYNHRYWDQYDLVNRFMDSMPKSALTQALINAFCD